MSSFSQKRLYGPCCGQDISLRSKWGWLLAPHSFAKSCTQDLPLFAARSTKEKECFSNLHKCATQSSKDATNGASGTHGSNHLEPLDRAGKLEFTTLPATHFYPPISPNYETCLQIFQFTNFDQHPKEIIPIYSSKLFKFTFILQRYVIQLPRTAHPRGSGFAIGQTQVAVSSWETYGTRLCINFLVCKIKLTLPVPQVCSTD